MNDSTKYTTNPSTLGKVVYLKHILDKNHKVTESYACINEKSIEACIQGGSADFYGWSEEESNYKGNELIIKTLQDKGFNCYLSASDSFCTGDSVYLDAGPGGRVGVEGGGSEYGNCEVNEDGSSSCR